MNWLKTKTGFKGDFTLPLKAGALVSLTLLFPVTFASADEQTGANSSTPLIQLASNTRYNFNRARYSTEPHTFKPKKKKRRNISKKKSLKKKLAAIQTWKVDKKNKDPVQLIVSRSKQKITVYKGAEVVVTSRVSSGKRGHATPTGVFSILGKKRFHRSNIYSRAPMPYMQRLTWSGIALHASNSVPNHPASHGCVRLPNSFAPKLFKFTERGAHVIIADEDPRIVALNGLDLFKPLSPKQRKKELAKIKADLIAKQIAARMKAEFEARKSAKHDLETETSEKALKRQPQIAELPDVEVKLSQSPLRILITRRIGRERVRDVQDMLRELGYKPGESDGYMGRDTGKAILAFQKSKGLQETGAFSDELETALYKAARKAKPPTGYLYVRQDFKNILSSPIRIKNPEMPLGTHLVTAQYFTPQDRVVTWRGMSLNDEVPDFLVRDEKQDDKQSQYEDNVLPIKLTQELVNTGKLMITPASATPGTERSAVSDPEKAAQIEKAKQEEMLDARSRLRLRAVLSRIQIPQSVATRLSLLLTPGSSIAISDKGLSKETTPHGTDFILLTRGSYLPR